MKLQQLHYIYEVSNNNLNVSATAEKLFTSQPGISRQIRLFEDELGLEIFTRSGKHLTGITPPGKKILAIAKEILERSAAIREIASEQTAPDRGELSILTSQLGARYILPKAFETFTQNFPSVDLKIRADAEGDTATEDDYTNTDVILSASNLKDVESRVILPCETFNYGLLIPNDHPLNQLSGNLSLDALLKYPLILDLNAATGTTSFREKLNVETKKLNIVLDSDDIDLIKSYVRMGMGVGVVPSVVYDRLIDSDLSIVDAGHIFDAINTSVSVKKLGCVRSYLLELVMQLTSNQGSEHLKNALNMPAVTEARFSNSRQVS
ncbi:MAG: LysR substrate-binding domain-containing protein [Pseudomonadota bacterium]